MTLLGTDVHLFYRLVTENVVECMPLIYTPVVGEACQKFGRLMPSAPPGRGIYISIEDKGRVREVLENWHTKDVRVIVVTDGERILGLGDLGVWGMGISVGKLLLYSACGGVHPNNCLPITLDVGCNTPSIRDDPEYGGLRRARVRGAEYDDFIDEFMLATRTVFSPAPLVQFEDFANANAARLLSKYRDDFCTFNDDIQGTAAVALAGILAALNLPNIPSNLADHTFLFHGAGSAGIGIANLITASLLSNPSPPPSPEAARRHCWFLDSKGLLHASRPSRTITHEKAPYAHADPPAALENDPSSDPLLAAVRALRPTVLIGVSTVPGSFSAEIIATMAEINERPVICALSNPTSKAECTAEAAYRGTAGRAVFVSGSPFEPVTLNGRTHVTGQGNNAYCFPGIGLGVILSGATTISERVFLEAARALAGMTSPAALERGGVYPPLAEIREISAEIAAAVWRQAEKEGVAKRPAKGVEEIRELMYGR